MEVFEGIEISEEFIAHEENYGYYASLAHNPYLSVSVLGITADNWQYHLNCIMNIMKDGIETDYVQNITINVVFADGIDVDLKIFDYFFNLIMWNCIIMIGDRIYSKHLFFPKHITQGEIKNYIDENFINVYKKKLHNKHNITVDSANMILNNIVDSTLYSFSLIDTFSLYLVNTINIEDTVELMNQNPRFRELMNVDLSNVPIEDVKNVGMKLTEEVVDIIRDSKFHCLADSFNAGEGVNKKQYREFSINIGSKPDGRGGIFPTIINKSFLNGGVNDIVSTFIESSGGRTAQIIAKCNVGTSGHFARLLSLNNKGTILHPNPNYVCESRNFEKIKIKSERMLKWFNDRYYRFSPDGLEYKLNCNTDKNLIGMTLYFRSPMTCASAARGEGICYRCYGDLAYTNCSINIGQLAAELISSALTQRLLSAKHLLESAMQKLGWSKYFYDFFEVNYNTITLIEEFDYRGYKLVIDPEGIYMESEEDDYEYNEYITSFSIKDPEGRKVDISTNDGTSIYISNELNRVIRKVGEPVEGNIEIDMQSLVNKSIFLVYLTNNELSKTLEMIKSIINKDSITSSYDRNGLLQKFVETVIEGGLNTIAVHLEVVLSNQLRDPIDILETPDWSVRNADYQILTLNKALTNNPSVTIAMSYQKLSKVLYNPLSYKMHKPSFIDLLFMEKPQEFMLNRDLIDTKYKPVPDKDNGNFIIWN